MLLAKMLESVFAAGGSAPDPLGELATQAITD